MLCRVCTLQTVDPNMPLGDVIQGLYTTDPTQDTRAAVDRADYEVPTWQHELDRIDQESI